MAHPTEPDGGVGEAHIGIVNVSDRASRGEYEPVPGREAVATLEQVVTSPWQHEFVVVADEQQLITDALIDLADNKECCLVITTGGTGPAPRDVTPEATRAVCAKVLPGFGELMRAVSLQVVPTAILSRQIAGIRGQCLVVNLPGSPKGVRECLMAVLPAIPDCIDLLGGPRIELNSRYVPAYRPADT